MTTYHGKRTQAGCEVTVDGEPLRMRSDLSGNATTAFDWGYVGAGQLSLALLSHLLDDDRRAQAAAPAFEAAVVANLPHDAWTLTGVQLAAALAATEGASTNTAGSASGSTPPTGGPTVSTTHASAGLAADMIDHVSGTGAAASHAPVVEYVAGCIQHERERIAAVMEKQHIDPAVIAGILEEDEDPPAFQRTPRKAAPEAAPARPTA